MKIKTGFLGAVAASLLMFSAPPASAGSPVPCPDSLVPVPAGSVPQGEQKDKNGNGLVCAYRADSKSHGGPDDDSVVDDIVL